MIDVCEPMTGERRDDEVVSICRVVSRIFVGNKRPYSGDRPAQGYSTGTCENAVPVRERIDLTHADVIKRPGQTKGSQHTGKNNKSLSREHSLERIPLV
jgi:hypothetical protein